MQLSVVVPVYNERAMFAEVMARIRSGPLPAGVTREVVIVDDGSTDGTRELLAAEAAAGATVIYHQRNQGKGAAIRTGLKEIGNWPLNTWGNVFPRTGMALQQEEPKAGAILAQRAGEITTRSAQPHVYVPLSWGQRSWGMRYWNPPALEPNDERTGSWQMLEPKTDNRHQSAPARSRPARRRHLRCRQRNHNCP